MSLKSCFSVRIKDHIRFVIWVFDLTRFIISCDGGVDGSLVWFVSRHNIRCSYIKLSVPWKWSHKCVLVFINAMLCGRIVRTQAGVHTGNLWSSIVIQIYKLYDRYIEATHKLHTAFFMQINRFKDLLFTSWTVTKIWPWYIGQNLVKLAAMWWSVWRNSSI
jgi:hypothetical protein